MIQKEQKQAIATLRLQGGSYAEIADYLNLSPNTVKSFCRRNKIAPLSQTRPENMDNPGGICKNCGAALEQVPSGRRKTFCSDRCRYIWWNRNRREKPYRLICQYCGRKFISFGNKNRAFCSRECYALSRYKENTP